MWHSTLFILPFSQLRGITYELILRDIQIREMMVKTTKIRPENVINQYNPLILCIHRVICLYELLEWMVNHIKLEPLTARKVIFLCLIFLFHHFSAVTVQSASTFMWNNLWKNDLGSGHVIKWTVTFNKWKRSHSLLAARESTKVWSKYSCRWFFTFFRLWLMLIPLTAEHLWVTFDPSDPAHFSTPPAATAHICQVE